MAPPERKRRGRLIAAGVAIALLLLAGGAAAFVVLNQPKDVSNPNVEFREEAPSATPEEELEPEEAAKPGKKKTRRVDRFIWAHYGYSRDRRRYLPVKEPPRPPFRELWQYQGHVLLEFPPVIGGKRLYLLNDSGRLISIHKHTGRRRWSKKLGALAAASPAYAGGTVYVVLLQRAMGGSGADGGRVVALDGKSGRINWSRELASRSESSPLIDGDTLYFGSENGTVYAMNARNGSVRWRFRADGAVKGGLALADGRLFFGDYGGRAYSIRASDGRQVWKTGTSGGRLGLSGGNFYSTPAVAYGRVYMGNTDGRMYSFSAGSGQIAWSRSTGGYVYSSPAVAAVPGYAPTVYFGSYSGRFYALDARTGSVRWSRGGYGRISGGATVIGDIVYFADLGNKRTHGLGARTGREVFTFERGSYNPVVSDGETIFLAGYHALYALQPLTVEQKQARTKARKAKAKLAKQDKRFCRQRAREAHRGEKRAQRRSTRRCVERKAERRQAVKRAECRKRARELHGKREKKVARSYRRCVDRRNIGGR
jgi:outer membrane protein assembly factor BamB